LLLGLFNAVYSPGGTHCNQECIVIPKCHITP